MADSKAGIARSFSCEVDCCSLYYEDFNVDFEGSAQANGYSQGTDCSGYSFGPYTASPSSWYSDNAGLATIDSSGLVDLPESNGGDTYVHGVFSQTNYQYSGGFCRPYYIDYDAALGILA